MAKDRGAAEITPLQRLISDIEREEPGRKLFWRSLLASLRRKRAKLPIPIKTRRPATAPDSGIYPVHSAVNSGRQRVATRGRRFGRLVLLIIGLVAALFASPHPRRK